MSPVEVSAYIGVPTSTLSVWRSTGRVHLPFAKAGRAVRYRREDIEAFLAGRATYPADEVGEPRRAPKKPSSGPALRLEEFKAKHGSLKCERCDEQVEEAEARIVSHFELPLFEGPRDPHDWHCFCTTCAQALTAYPSVRNVEDSELSYTRRA